MSRTYFITDLKIAVVGETVTERSLIHHMIKERGGIVHNTVKKTTDLVVLGYEIPARTLNRLEKTKQTVLAGEFLELIDTPY